MIGAFEQNSQSVAQSPCKILDAELKFFLPIPFFGVWGVGSVGVGSGVWVWGVGVGCGV
jgi:hypothetical protein